MQRNFHRADLYTEKVPLRDGAVSLFKSACPVLLHGKDCRTRMGKRRHRLDPEKMIDMGVREKDKDRTVVLFTAGCDNFRERLCLFGQATRVNKNECIAGCDEVRVG
jgi:hypothetical protein